jgi:probable rRNA maturation factor
VALDRSACRQLLRRIAADHEIAAGEISVAVVDKATIARLHAQFLQDPSPTDVLSFVLARRDAYLEGEIVACAEVAAEVAQRLHRPADGELLLYIVHGMLHLVGYDDLTLPEARTMRQRERAYVGVAGGPARRPVRRR